MIEIFAGLLNPDRLTRRSVADIMVSSSWLESERQKQIPESVSVVFAQKMSRPIPEKKQVFFLICPFSLQRITLTLGFTNKSRETLSRK